MGTPENATGGAVTFRDGIQLTPARRRENSGIDWVAMSPANSARASRPYSRLVGATVPEERAVLVSPVASPRYKGAVPTVEVQLFEKVSAGARPRVRRKGDGSVAALSAADLGTAVSALRRFALQFDGFDYPVASLSMYLRDQASSVRGRRERDEREYPRVDAKVATVMQAVLREHAMEYADVREEDPGPGEGGGFVPADNPRAHFSDRKMEELAAANPLGAPGGPVSPDVAKEVEGFLEGARVRVGRVFGVEPESGEG